METTITTTQRIANLKTCINSVIANQGEDKTLDELRQMLTDCSREGHAIVVAEAKSRGLMADLEDAKARKCRKLGVDEDEEDYVDTSDLPLLRTPELEKVRREVEDALADLFKLVTDRSYLEMYSFDCDED